MESVRELLATASLLPLLPLLVLLFVVAFGIRRNPAWLRRHARVRVTFIILGVLLAAAGAAYGILSVVQLGAADPRLVAHVLGAAACIAGLLLIPVFNR